MVRFSSSFSFVNSSIIMWSSGNNVTQDLGFSYGVRLKQSSEGFRPLSAPNVGNPIFSKSCIILGFFRDFGMFGGLWGILGGFFLGFLRDFLGIFFEFLFCEFINNHVEQRQ